MQVLTYTSSIPTISKQMATQRFEEFECAFGHDGIVSHEATQILALQNILRNKLVGHRRR